MSASASQFPNWFPTDFLRPWWQLAPGNLTQPILSGYSININSNNSSSPQTEADIVAKHSYGRQIGRISDALCELILAQHRKPPETGPLADFLSMWSEIDRVKTESAKSRLEQIKADLLLLKEKQPAEFAQLRDALGEALRQLD